MISIVIPCYNEEENINTYENTLFPIIEEISQRYNEKFEYIFVNDGSKDNTLKALSKLAEKHTDVKVVSHDINRGIGAAIKTGISAVSGEYAVFLDSDLTYRPADISILLDEIEKNPNIDCVSASPYSNNENVENVSMIRLLPSKTVNCIYRVLLSTKLTCFSGIFRIYKSNVLKSINIESNNFDVCAEIISKLIIKGYTITEVAVTLHNREYGESKLNIYREILNNIRLFSKIIRVKYIHLTWN